MSVHRRPLARGRVARSRRGGAGRARPRLEERDHPLLYPLGRPVRIVVLQVDGQHRVRPSPSWRSARRPSGRARPPRTAAPAPPQGREPLWRHVGVALEAQAQHGQVLVLQPLARAVDLGRRDADRRAARLPPGPIGSGSEGCDSTGATTAGSVIIARAKLPVKHMPTAPTPRPPHSACACRASARSQSTIGLERSVGPDGELAPDADAADHGRRARTAAGSPCRPRRTGAGRIPSCRPPRPAWRSAAPAGAGRASRGSRSPPARPRGDRPAASSARRVGELEALERFQAVVLGHRPSPVGATAPGR